MHLVALLYTTGYVDYNIIVFTSAHLSLNSREAGGVLLRIGGFELLTVSGVDSRHEIRT